MHETTASTGTDVSSHHGRNMKEALNLATRQMEQYVMDRCDEWEPPYPRHSISLVRGHITALSTTTSVDESDLPVAHIVFAYELRAVWES